MSATNAISALLVVVAVVAALPLTREASAPIRSTDREIDGTHHETSGMVGDHDGPLEQPAEDD
jgi:hypothetical protein